MNLYSESGHPARLNAVTLVIAAILFCASNSPALGQRSVDRDNPTLLNSKEVLDELDGSDKQYFYMFNAGPGTIELTLEVKASNTNAGASLDLFDSNSRPLLSNVLAQAVDGSSERVVKKVLIGARRNLLMRIKGIKYGDDGGTGTYRVVLGGDVNIGQDAKPAGDAPAAGNVLTGELDGTDRTRFHELKVTGPGTVTFLFRVITSDTNAGATFTVTNVESKPLISDVLVQAVDGGNGLVTKSFTFAKAQPVIITVKGIKYGDSGGHGVYAVQLGGPVTVVK